jgi:hypothetical protein
MRRERRFLFQRNWRAKGVAERVRFFRYVPPAPHLKMRVRIYRNAHGKFSHPESRKSSKDSRSRALARRWHDSAVAESNVNKALGFRVTEQPRVLHSAGRHSPENGTYRVLATIDTGENSYRVFGDLHVDDGTAELRLYRFEIPHQDEWFAERKINLPVAWPELAPLEQEVNGAEFVLVTPVTLDEAKATALFGASGPPVV